MTETMLDQAHAAFAAAPENEAAQVSFYGRLAAAELFVMLSQEPEGDQIVPEIFDLGDARFVLVFDTEERLARFADRIVPYVALSGRALAEMLANQNVGLALNPDVAPSSMMVPAEIVDWLAGALEARPTQAEGRPEDVFPPKGLPEGLLKALDSRLAAASGLARMAYLVGVQYDSGARGHLLGFVGVVPGAEGALALAVQDALTFSGLDAAALDVAFFDESHSMSAVLARHGLRFDLPQAEQPAPRAAPGSDPDRPPLLK
ncbi:SseB family protein [Primorskyibacter sp. S187A]|uniref:SseB family protein n=1 Tax=Primorskyibacter sp. S187A TaxID=3415130 RepID=UPI003C7B2162